MRVSTRAAAIAGVSASALLAGCAGGGGGGSANTSQPAGRDGGTITVRGCNPQNPLVPSSTTETCGGNILDAVTAKLVHYAPEDAKPENDIAESITTRDNQNFTVKLKKGYKFSDGTEVKADNFVKAWNWAAYSPNAQTSGYFLEPIQGYADLQSADPKAKPKATEMSGLTKIDDHTFTIKTTEKVSNLPVRLGYTAFAPLPDSFFANPKAYGDKPVGAGPYQVDSWTKNQEVKLSKNPHYSGSFGGTADHITFKIYQDSEAAYKDVLAGKLDVTDEVPTTALIDDKYKTDFPDRNTSRAGGTIALLPFAAPSLDSKVANPKLRQAISMAIDRSTIVKTIFNNTRLPATGWVSPVVDGYRADACGEFCTYNPEKAKALFQQAGGYTGTLTLSYNADASHKDWTTAVCNSLKNTLGIDCLANPVVDHKTMRALVQDRKMKGMFRTGWQMDYPSIENFLSPVFKTGASSNDGDYSNPRFDKLLAEAAASADAAAANAKYQEAEKLLVNDMPAVPLWYQTTYFGWSDKVTNVKITAFGTYDLRSLQAK